MKSPNSTFMVIPLCIVLSLAGVKLVRDLFHGGVCYDRASRTIIFLLCSLSLALRTVRLLSYLLHALPSPLLYHIRAVTIRGLLYAKEMTFRERMARLQFSRPHQWLGAGGCGGQRKRGGGEWP